MTNPYSRPGPDRLKYNERRLAFFVVLNLWLAATLLVASVIAGPLSDEHVRIVAAVIFIVIESFILGAALSLPRNPDGN